MLISSQDCNFITNDIFPPFAHFLMSQNNAEKSIDGKCSIHTNWKQPVAFPYFGVSPVNMLKYKNVNRATDLQRTHTSHPLCVNMSENYQILITGKGCFEKEIKKQKQSPLYPAVKRAGVLWA